MPLTPPLPVGGKMSDLYPNEDKSLSRRVGVRKKGSSIRDSPSSFDSPQTAHLPSKVTTVSRETTETEKVGVGCKGYCTGSRLVSVEEWSGLAWDGKVNSDVYV